MKYICPICGGETHALKQWWNQDTGYAICGKCGEAIIESGKELGDFLKSYGVRGIHWGLTARTIDPIDWRGYRVPARTPVRLLINPHDARSNWWTIDDFGWLPKRDSFNRHDAEYYGIQVNVENIQAYEIPTPL